MSEGPNTKETKIVSQNTNNCMHEQSIDVTTETYEEPNEPNNISNEIIPTMTDDNSSINEESVATLLAINETGAGNVNNMINERKYEIKSYILPVVITVLLLTFLHNLLGLILCVVYLITECYLFFLFTFLGITIPAILLSCISIRWVDNCEEKDVNPIIYFVKHFIVELIKYKPCLHYTKCRILLRSFEDSIKFDDKNGVKLKYIEAIRKIEDLRNFIATNALLQGTFQLVPQIWILLLLNDNIYLLPLQVIIIILSAVLIIFCVLIYRRGFCDFRNDLGIYRITILTHFITVMSMFLYIFDIISDLVVTIKYYYFSHFIRGSIALIFIIIPGFYNTWHEYYRKKINIKLDKTLVISMIFNLNPLFGYWTSLKLLLKTRQSELNQNKDDQKQFYLEYIKNNFNVAISRYNECFTESCFQLIIQLSFLLITINFSDLQNEKINIVSSLISVMNIAVSLVLFFRSKRIKDEHEDPLPILGMLIQFLGYLPVASRVVALSFLASVEPFYTVLSVFFHWLVVFLWTIYCSGQHSLGIHLNNAGQSIIYTFTPAINNVYIETIFQAGFFVENIAAIISWDLSKYGRVTSNAIYILAGAIVVPSVIGWICRYLYRTKYPDWMEKYRNDCAERNLSVC